MQALQNLLKRLGYIIASFPKLSAVIMLLFCGLLFSGIFSLKLSGDVGNIFNQNSRAVIEFEALVKNYKNIEREIYLVVEPKDPNASILTPNVLDEITNLSLEIEFLDNVSSVTSIANLRKIDLESGQFDQIIAPGNIEKNGIQSTIDQLRNHAIAKNRLISEDGRSTLLLISLKPIEERKGLLHEVRLKIADLSAQHLTQSDFYFTGFLAVSAEIVQNIYRDQILILSGGAMLGLILGYLFFRRIVFVLATAAPSVISVAWTLGMMGWFGFSINVMSNVVPTIMMVIAFADSMHMVDYIRDQMERGRRPKQAILSAFKNVAPACFLTSLTTMIAFFSLVFSSTPIVADFGKAASIGTSLSFFAAIFLSSLVILIWSQLFPFKVVKSKKSNGVIHEFFSHHLGNFAKDIPRQSKKFILLGLGLLAITGYFHFQNEPQYRYSENLSSKSPAGYAISVIDQKLGGTNNFHFVVMAQDSGAMDLSDPKLFELYEKLANLIDQQAPVKSSMNVLNIAHFLSDETLSSFAQLVDELPKEVIANYLSDDHKNLLLSAATEDFGAINIRHFLSDMNVEIDALLAQYPNYNIKITGLATMSALETDEMIGELNYGLAVAMSIIIILMGFVFRSSFYAFASILPNFLPILAGGTLLYFFGDGLQFTTIIALTIAFGIAVDDSIHFLFQYQLNIKKYQIEEAILKTMKRVGPVLIASTIMLSAGLSLMLLSSLPQMQLFGMVVIFILNVALIADLAILPSIFYMNNQFQKRQSLKE